MQAMLGAQPRWLVDYLENSHEEMRVCMKLSPPGSLACISCSHASRSWPSVNPSASKNSGNNNETKNAHFYYGRNNAGDEASDACVVFSGQALLCSKIIRGL